jgi:hypothetical protein
MPCSSHDAAAAAPFTSGGDHLAVDDATSAIVRVSAWLLRRLVQISGRFAISSFLMQESHLVGGHRASRVTQVFGHAPSSHTMPEFFIAAE